MTLFEHSAHTAKCLENFQAQVAHKKGDHNGYRYHGNWLDSSHAAKRLGNSQTQVVTSNLILPIYSFLDYTLIEFPSK